MLQQVLTQPDGGIIVSSMMDAKRDLARRQRLVQKRLQDWLDDLRWRRHERRLLLSLAARGERTCEIVDAAVN